jgi:hypothetical protein
LIHQIGHCELPILACDSQTILRSIFTLLFCSSWIAFVSFRKVRGLMVFLPFLKLARKMAAITLTIWKKGVEFDAKQLNRQAA